MNNTKLFGILLGGVLVGIVVLATVITLLTREKSREITPAEANLCGELLKSEGEISCEDALKVAKSMYSGEITAISKANNLRLKTMPASEGIDSWRIVMMLDKPLQQEGKTGDEIVIVVARKTGEVTMPVRLVK